MSKSPLVVFGVEITIETPDHIEFELAEEAGGNAKVLTVGKQRLCSLWRYDGEDGEKSLILSYAEAYPTTKLHYGDNIALLAPISRSAELEIGNGSVIKIQETDTNGLRVFVTVRNQTTKQLQIGKTEITIVFDHKFEIVQPHIRLWKLLVDGHEVCIFRSNPLRRIAENNPDWVTLIRPKNRIGIQFVDICDWPLFPGTIFNEVSLSGYIHIQIIREPKSERYTMQISQ
jgi:hypothetical protein